MAQQFKNVGLVLYRALISHNRSWIYSTTAPDDPDDLNSHSKLKHYLSRTFPNYKYETTFDDNTVNRTRKKSIRTELWIQCIRLSFWILICIFLFCLLNGVLRGNPVKLLISVASLLLSAFSFKYLLSSTQKNHENTRQELIDTAKDPASAKRVISFLEKKILDKRDFSFIDRNGIRQFLPSGFYLAKNALIFVVGPDEYRNTIPYSGPPPIGDLYISKGPPSKDSRSRDAVLSFLRSREHVKLALSLVNKYAPKDPAAPNRKLAIDRERWVNFLKRIDLEWDQWISSDNKINPTPELKKVLIETLKIRNKPQAQIDKLYFDFIHGENRNFRNWIIKLDIIDSQTLTLNIQNK